MDEDGTVHLRLKTEAENGYWFLPFSPDPINFHLNLKVTKDGRVGLDPGGTRDGYPSLAGFGYWRVGSTEVINTVQIFTRTEGKPADLKPPEEEKIPPVDPKGPR